jgi:UDP-2,3-diacylglucosamine pyrophosphatase LpxH
MNLKIYSDLHWGQTSEILKDVVPSSGVFFTGDIFDIKNTSKKIIKEQLNKQSSFIYRCKEVGAHYILGNHDLLPDNELNVAYLDENFKLTNVLSYVPRHIVIGDVLLTHGHYIAWDQVKIDEWKNKKPDGVGVFRKFTLSVQDMYKRGTWKPDAVESERAYQLAKTFSCKTVIFGHHHTETLVDIDYKGVRIINVPRGLTELSL